MNKRGEEGGTSLMSSEAIKFILTLLFILIVAGIAFKFYLSRGCPAGYDLIESTEFNPSIEKICGDTSGEKVSCCARKSDPLQVCKYYRDSKRIECNRLTKFNLFNVCSDDTACGVSTSECSGGYCKNGICFVKDGVGRCVERFEIDGKEIVVNKDSCRKDFEGVSVGSSCEGEEGRYCVFDEFTRKGKCSGVEFSVSVDDAQKECKVYCDEARDAEHPLNSRFCIAKFPIKVEGKVEPVEYYCYSDGPIKTSCGIIGCKPESQIPVL